MSVPVCCYCSRPIVSDTGWGMSEDMVTGEGKVYHLECAEMNGDEVVVYIP